MINYIWGSMLVIGVIYSVFSGNVNNLSTQIIDSSKDSVDTCITVLGVICMWMGILKIAEKSGLVEKLSSKMEPIVSFLYTNIPLKHDARKYISLNMIANFLGLGWAATPFGLKAMKEMQKINKDKKVASDEMCMFLLINISSIQLVSISIIAYRVKYSSGNPVEIIVPGIIATTFSTMAAIIYGKFKNNKVVNVANHYKIENEKRKR